MQDQARQMIAHRRNQKEKKDHILLDVILEEKDVFSTEEAVSFNFMFLASSGLQ